MDPFEFFSVPRIVFGRGTASRLGELAAELGRRALVVTNAGRPGDGGIVERVAACLTAASVDACFWVQPGEPVIEDVEHALAVAREAGCDVVVGLGGGSAIDTAKAVAGLLTNGGLPLDYLEVIGRGQKLRVSAAPWIAAPTTAGTGAEVTRNAVLGCPEKRFKASLRSPYLLAHVALIDAELAVGVPREVTASSGMDALCQLIESYTSNRAQPITDALALKGIAAAAHALPRVWADGSDLAAREEMALAAMLSGLTLANAGLGAVHGFAAPLGANFPVPHGTVCAGLLPHVMAANVQALRAQAADHPWLTRYATIGRTLTGHGNLADEDAIEAGTQFIRDLACQLEIPGLAQFGLGPDQIEAMVALARQASSMRYNPVVLSEPSLADILRRAL
jgi:alcohol dehydrogenase class IV